MSAVDQLLLPPVTNAVIKDKKSKSRYVLLFPNVAHVTSLSTLCGEYVGFNKKREHTISA